MAKVINTWEELVGLESDNYYLKINTERCNGWIKPKDKDGSGYYLTTHSFYEDKRKSTTLLLQKCGFDVELSDD